MEERMCQQRKSFSKHTQTNYLYQQTQQPDVACHQCEMCSSFSTSSSSSSSTTSSFSSLSSSSTKDNPCSRRESFDKKNNNGCFIQQHLQSMFILLRREETLKMAVKLESAHPSRTRYLVVVSRTGRNQTEECCLLGIDCNKRTTVGLVLKVLADTAIRLDGDGGFSVSVCGRQHIFKPVSVQAMWSALQTLYKVSSKARECNYFEGGNTHDWVNYYEQSIESDRSCLNEWHAMNDIESRRPPSPDSLRSKPRERLETERVIRSTLKEIMMSVDLDEVTSKYIRSRLEEQLDMDLREFKSFIDQEMLVILGQMDAATEVFPHVYLGSEWNASNLEELNKNGICHILNVTREIDNFFPGTFDYLNIRVYDDDNTDLLKHWDNTYKYINKVKKENSKVLVHCKMGISRSASVVIAYAMKAYNWDFKKAFEYVRKKRSCIKPNHNFINQLETYQGMLDAMKNKEKLQRSKSETNLKSSANAARYRTCKKKNREENTLVNPPIKINEKASESGNDFTMLRVNSGVELAQLSLRPKSWSPDNLMVSEIFSSTGTMSQSLEQINVCKLSVDSHSSSASSLSTSPPRIPPAPPLPPLDSRYNLNVRMPCDNGLTYSVSQNKIVQLYSAQNQARHSSASNENESFKLGSTCCENDDTVNHSGADTPAYALQMPSQFQGNGCTFITKMENSSLVIKDASASRFIEDKDKLKSRSSSNSCSNSSSSRDIYFMKTEKECSSLSQRAIVEKRISTVDAVLESSSVGVNTQRTTTSSTLLCYQAEQPLQSGSVPRRLPQLQLLQQQDDLKSRLVPFDAAAAKDAGGNSRTNRKKYGGIDGTSQIECNVSSNTFNNNDQQQQLQPSFTRGYSSTSGNSVDRCNPLVGSSSSSNVINAVQQLERLKHPRSSRLNAVTTVGASTTAVCTPAAGTATAEKEDETSRGLVQNLKKEFEAKCHLLDRDKRRKRCSFQEDSNNNNNHNNNSKTNSNSNDNEAGSLPLSPVSEHGAAHGRTGSSPREDLSVRKLVGKYEKTKYNNRERYSSKCERKQQPPIPPRKSSLDFHLAQTKLASTKGTAPNVVLTQHSRPHRGVAPIVKSLFNKPNEIRTSVTKAANMFQQNKPYPLSKLPFCKQRSNASSVYNTV